MSTATLSSKFQISVPKDIREALQLKPGQKLVFLNTGSAIKLVPQPPVSELFGIAKGADTSHYRDHDERRMQAFSSMPGKSSEKSK